MSAECQFLWGMLEGMPTLLMLAVLAAPSSPHLLDSELAVVPPQATQVSLAQSPDQRYSAIKQLVSGCVLIAISALFLVPGIYLLSKAPTQAEPIPFIAIGWSLTGFGLIIDLVGLPLLIAGSIRTAMYRSSGD